VDEDGIDDGALSDLNALKWREMKIKTAILTTSLVTVGD
jgi:hypothetical protein